MVTLVERGNAILEKKVRVIRKKVSKEGRTITKGCITKLDSFTRKVISQSCTNTITDQAIWGTGKEKASQFIY